MSPVDLPHPGRDLPHWVLGKEWASGLTQLSISHLSGPAEGEVGTHSHSAPEQSPTGRFSWLGQSKLTPGWASPSSLRLYTGLRR